MGRGKSTAWLHVTNITDKEGYVKCVHCGHEFFASNATRVRNHFTKGKVCQSADASLLKEMEEMEALSTKKNKKHKASKKTLQKKGRLRKMQTTMMMSNVFGFFGFYFEIKTKPKKLKKNHGFYYAWFFESRTLIMRFDIFFF
jgi:hypothetical protein